MPRWIDVALCCAVLALWIAVPVFGAGAAFIDSFPDRTIALVPLSVPVLAACGFALFLTRFAFRARGPASPRWATVRTRLSWLALNLSISLLLAPWCAAAATFLLVRVTPLLLAWAALGLYMRADAGGADRRWADAGLILLTGTLLYWMLGIYFTNSVGEHAGDEGHYLMQARSLIEDGDLDLRNNLGDPDPQDRAWFHISRFSRNAAWYSWHTPGLAFLLAPFEAGSVSARHVLLGLLSGLGLAGVYLLGRDTGASRSSAWMVSLLLGGSAFWGIYSSRALPEVLGGMLAVYAFLAARLQRRRPVAGLLLSVCCIGFLPWAHTRFIPAALVLIGIFGLHGLLAPRPWKSKLPYLACYTVLAVLALAVFFGVQYHRFEHGSAYPIQHLLFSQLSGLWYVLASDRGILVAFPVFACALAGCLALFRTASERLTALCAMLLFLAVWITSCSTRWYTGGASVPGRFLLVTVPVLMAVLARTLDDANTEFRLLTFYAGWTSVGLFAFQLSVLPFFHKTFPSAHLAGELHPLLTPLPRILPEAEAGAALWPALAFFGLAVFLALAPPTATILRRAGLALLAAALLAPDYFPEDRMMNRTPRLVAHELTALDRAGTLVFAIGDTRAPVSLFSAGNAFTGPHFPGVREITGQRAPDLHDERALSYPLLPENDWEGRGYRWATLVRPIPAGNGERAVAIDAEVRGASAVELVIREGRHVRLTRRVDPGAAIREVLLFHTEGAGDLYIVARFVDAEAAGDFLLHRLACSPYRGDLLERGNLTLDPPDR